MHSKSPQEISFIIYSFLKTKACDISEIHQRLQESEINISRRSVYRYLERLSSMVSEIGEVLEIEILENNRKKFFIRLNRKSSSASDRDWIQFINSFLLFKSNFDLSASEDSMIEKIIEYFHGNAPLKTQLLSLLSLNNEMYLSTRFGDLLSRDRLIEKLSKFIYYFGQNVKLKIVGYSIDTISENELPSIGEELIPINIWYHRGNFVLRFYSVIQDRIFAIEIDMIDKLELSKTKYTFKENERVSQLSEICTFGYHQPIIPGEFDIVLHFEKIPGTHILNRFWVPNQKISKLSSGLVEMKFRSEINVELIGWIAMWLDDITVVAPNELKKLLTEKYQKMTKKIIEQELN